MPRKREKELQKLRGVGEILAARFVAAGLDTFAKVAAAGTTGLAQIRGVNPRLIPAIISQAESLAEGAKGDRRQKVEELKKSAALLKKRLQDMPLQLKERFQAELTGTAGRKVEKQLLKTLASLEKVERKLGNRVKKTGKGLVRAEERLITLADASFKDVGRGLKKARKSLRKVFA
ncbi:helix-hairpin-helix domain-containing protein [Geobacter sp. AOG1]|uniref:helix-hairpin-helix domain-containing protein n=1 Tax=Geobacter sp. AOG1 TaxID=1566346 RepID=UPI001CC448BF|nr:helix-hairpin-helix domain-containing protein [Geobacter sp. AOG1]GFE57916.1 DNA-binding protein [Geobacter sp. AOG1]